MPLDFSKVLDIQVYIRYRLDIMVSYTTLYSNKTSRNYYHLYTVNYASVVYLNHEKLWALRIYDICNMFILISNMNLELHILEKWYK